MTPRKQPSQSRPPSPNRRKWNEDSSSEPGKSEPQRPDPKETQPPSREGSEAAAAAFGTGSSGGEFVSDPGPDFDPKHAPDAPPLEEELEQTFEEWTEEQIRGVLILQGNVTHALLKVSDEDKETWKQTEDDLSSIAPPLTRILNRYDVTRAAAAAGDEILLGTALIGYGAKNYTRRRLLIARKNAAEPEPVTGTPAPPESGPEHDPEWQRVHDVPPALVPKGARR